MPAGTGRAQTLADGLDIPGAQVSTPAGSGWRVVTGAAASDGVDCVVTDSGAGGPLSVRISGPGILRYRWQQEGPLGDLNLSAVNLLGYLQDSAGIPGGNQPDTLRGTSGWQEKSVSLLPGPNILTWTHTRGTVADGATNSGWLDAFSYEPAGVPVTIAEAVENAAVWQAAPGTVFGGWRESAAPDARTYAILEAGTAPAGEVLRVGVPAGWIYVRWRRDANVTLGQAGLQTEFDPATGWETAYGFLADGGDLVWTAQPGFAAMAVDTLATSTGTIGDALDTPAEQVWTDVSQFSSLGLVGIAGPGASHDGLDSLILGAPFTGLAGEVSTLVSGAARLDFWHAGSLDVFRGDSEFTSWFPPSGSPGIEPETGWKHRSITLPPSGEALRLSGLSYGEGSTRVDEVTITPLPEVTPSEAMDSPGITWTLPTGPDAPWYAVADPEAADGVDCLRAGPLRNDGVATATWSGGGTLDVQTLTGPYSRLLLAFDGLDAGLLPRTGVWQPLRLEMAGGTHSAAWTWQGGYEGYAWERAGALDAATWSAGRNAYADAADADPAAWVSSGAGVWEVTTAEAAQGGSSIASPAIPAGGSAWIETRIEGPADVTFVWKATGKAPFSLLAEAGSGRATMVAPGGWLEATVPVGETGPVALRWTLTATGEQPLTAGTVHLDHLRIARVSRPVTAAGVEAAGWTGPALELTGGSQAVAGPADSQDGISALQLTAPGPPGMPNRLPSLKTTVPGAFDLTFWWKIPGSGSTQVKVDGETVMTLPGSDIAGWRRALLCRGDAGPHTIEWLGVVSGVTPLLLDGMTLSDYGAPGTFTASVGAPAGARVVTLHLGTDHSLADTEQNHDGSVSVRLGADMPGLSMRVPGSRLTLWLRHDRRDAGNRLGGPAGAWYPQDWASGGYPVQFVPGAAVPGWHVWMDSMASVDRPATLGDVLRSPELVWTASPPEAWTSGYGGRPESLPSASGETLQTTVTGPGFLYGTGASALVEVGGVSTAVTAASGAYLIPVPAGPQLITFRRLAGTDQIWVNPPCLFAPAVTAAAGLDLDLAPEWSGLSLPAPMSGMLTPVLARDGEDVAVTPLLNSTPFEFAVPVPGPGRLLLRSGVAAGTPTLTARVDDGVPVSPGAVTVPPGAHVVTFSATAADTGEHRLWLDMLEWQSDAAVPALAAAQGADVPAAAMQTRAAAPFTEIPRATATGGTVAASPVLRTGEYSWIEIPVTGPGLLFYRATEVNDPVASTPHGKLILSTDSGVSTQTTATGKDSFYPIRSAGPVLVRINWQHGQLGDAAVGNTARLLLDDVFFLTDSEPGGDLNAVLPVPRLTWGTQTGTGPLWRAVSGVGSRPPLLVCTGAPGRILPFAIGSSGRLGWDGGNPPLKNQPTNATITPNSTSTADQNYQNVFLLASQAQLQFQGVPGDVVIRNVRLEAEPRTLAEALGTPGQAWTSGGGASWAGYVRNSTTDAVTHSFLPDGQSAWIETTVQAPARVSWSGSLSCAAGDGMTMSAGGTILYSKTGNGTSQTLTDARWITGSGPVPVRWTYTKDAAGAAGSDGLVLTDVAVAQSDPAGINAALDASGLAFTQGSNAGLGFLPEISADSATGGSRLTVTGPSAIIPAPSFASTWLETTVTGPGLVSFASRQMGVTSTGGTVDPITTFTEGMDRVWIELEDATPRTLRLTGSFPGTSTTGTASIDALRFDTPQPVTLLNAPGVVWTTGSLPWKAYGDATWQAATGPAPGQGESSWLEAACTGPGLLNFRAGGVGSLYINDTLIEEIGTSQRISRSVHVPAGVTRVRFLCGSPELGPEKLFVHDVKWTPGIAALAAAAGVDGLVMILTDPPIFSIENSDPPGPGQSYLKILSGKRGTVKFLPPGAGRIALSARKGSAAWLQTATETAVSPAVHELPFSTSSPDFSQFTGVRYLPVPLVTPAEAVDSACIAWQAPSAGTWTGVFSTGSHDGEDCLAASAVTPGVPAVISGTVTGPAVLRFWWQRGGRLSADGMVCAERVNTEPFSLGEPDWSQMQVDLGAGPHILTWSSDDEMKLDAFTCTSTPELLPVLPAVATVAVTQAGAWRPAAGGLLIADGGPVTDRNIALIVNGPALIAPDMEVSAVFTKTNYTEWLTAPGPVLRTFIYPFTATAARLAGVALTETTPAEALGVSFPVRSTGWRGFTAGNIRTALVEMPPGSTATAPLEVEVTGPALLWWDLVAYNPFSLRPTLDWATVPASAGSDQSHPYLVIPGGVHTVRWVAGSTGPSFLTMIPRMGLVPLNEDNNLAAWLSARGLSAGSLTSDPDHDGRSVLDEFLLGGDPATADAGALDPLVVSGPGTLFPSIEFTARTDGALFEMQDYSAARPVWSPRPAHMEVLSDAFPYRRVRLVSDTPLYFPTELFRVKASVLTP